MNARHDTSTPVAGDDDHFDPRDAAALLASTRRSAVRRFEQRTPLVYLLSAVVVFCAYGMLWLSVRDQHPYVGPSLAVIGWVYVLVVVAIALSAVAYGRARHGISGASHREDTLRGLAIGLPWIAVFVFDGALKADGFGPDIVYGVFDAAAPWLVVGTALGAYAAGRGKRLEMAGGLCVVAAGTTAAFFGPSGCWGVLAVAGGVALVVLAVVQYVRLRGA